MVYKDSVLSKIGSLLPCKCLKKKDARKSAVSKVDEGIDGFFKGISYYVVTLQQSNVTAYRSKGTTY